MEKTTSSGVESIQTKDDDISCPHVKEEIKTEQEELQGKRGGYICPICKKHFFIVDYFITHVNEHHFNEKDNPASDKSKTAHYSVDSMMLSTLSDKETHAKVFKSGSKALVSNIAACNSDLQTPTLTPISMKMKLYFTMRLMRLNIFCYTKPSSIHQTIL